MAEPKYAVGRGRPPKHTQFRKGRSGNPAGRPRGSRNLLAEMLSELESLTEATIGGSRVKVSKGRLLMKALLAKAVQGDIKAAALIIDMAGKLHTGEPPAAQEAEAAPPEDTAILAAYLKRMKRGGVDE